MQRGAAHLRARRAYASAAWAGALALVGLQGVGVSPVVAAWAGMGVVLAARLLAMAFRITFADLQRTAIGRP